MLNKKILSLFALVPYAFSFLPLASCGSNGIVFANYESYMSEPVKRKIESKYNTTFLPYETNEEIENKFKKYYDAAIPSTYELLNLKNQDLITKIDWTKFNITVEGQTIKNGLDALNSEMFSPSIKYLIQELDKKYQAEHLYPSTESLLDYGIPYFAQTFSFAYKGEAIQQLENATSWSDVFNTINSYSPDLDPRFTPKGERKIAIVNDSRSMFGVANSINGIGVNPGDIVSQKDFLNIYKDFSNNFKKGYTYFNSDSGQIISTLAKNYPDGASCGIAYNGDLLYAAQGGGVEDPADASDFHFCNLDDSLIALDMVVINKNVVSNQQKCDKLYEIIKDICLSGTSDGEDITKKNADGLYTYDSMQNFADVEYTSPLNKVYNYVMTGNFFEGTEAQIKLYRKIFDINTKIDNVTDYVEERMSSELAKSNMHWAYEEMKSYL